MHMKVDGMDACMYLALEQLWRFRGRVPAASCFLSLSMTLRINTKISSSNKSQSNKQQQNKTKYRGSFGPWLVALPPLVACWKPLTRARKICDPAVLRAEGLGALHRFLSTWVVLYCWHEETGRWVRVWEGHCVSARAKTLNSRHTHYHGLSKTTPNICNPG